MKEPRDIAGQRRGRECLRNLVTLIPPPPDLLYAVGTANPIALPTDFKNLVKQYGSGEFNLPFRPSKVACLMNPNAPDYLQFRDWSLLVLREIVANDHIKISIYPEVPGLLPWAWGDTVHYYWMTQGAPDKWPIVVMYKERFYDFDCSATCFLFDLLSGHLDPTFLGWSNGPFDPTKVRFLPHIGANA